MDNAQSFDFSEYIAAFKRRRLLIVAVALPFVMFALALALGLPDVYRSTALIQFAEAEISGELENASRGEATYYYEDEYVSSLRDAVLSEERLSAILDKIQIDPNQAEDPGEALGTVSGNTSVNTVRTQVLDPANGREREIISGFTVSYSSQDPVIAQKVAAWLAQAFVEASRNLMRERASAAAQFYAGEADSFRKNIAELEAKLADFKKANYGSLPELTDVNINVLDRTERDLDNVQMEMRSLNQDRIFLMQRIEEARGTAPDSDLLKQLEAEYSQKSAIYDENHPDLVALRRQLENLRAGGPSAGNLSLPEQLASQRAVLATVRQRYSEDHPDVKRLQRNIEALESRIARGEKTGGGAANPVVSQLQTQLSAMNTQLASLQVRSAELRAKMTDFEGRVETTPQVERQYQTLTRDLDLARKKYDELVGKRIDAELKTSAIAGGRSDELKLVQPPGRPGSPAEPRRAGIMVIAVVLGLAVAFAVAMVIETLDQSVRGSRDIVRAFSVTPLVAVPNIHDALAKRRLFKLAAAYVGSLAIGSLLLLVVIRASAA